MTPPKWAKRLFDEIDMLKRTIEEQKRSTWDFYDFVNRFRKYMMPDPNRNHFPEVRVGKRRIGVTLSGLLYDKETGNTLKRTDAFDIYKRLYKEYRKAKR